MAHVLTLALRMRAACIALGMSACGEVETLAPPAEFARGVELLAAQGIETGPYFVDLRPAPLMLCRNAPDERGEWRQVCEHVGGFVGNIHYGLVVVEQADCPANGALLHELVHIAIYRETGNADHAHEQTAWWNAVGTANAIWRAEVCE